MSSLSSLVRPLVRFSALVRHHTGYIPFEGRIGLFENDQSRIAAHIKNVDLQPVKKITFQLDPFRDNVQSLREVMFHLSNKRVKATNLKCLYRTDILSDFSDPEMKVDLNDGRTVRFKSGKISTVELLNHLNKIVLPLVVVKDTTITETKAAKLAAGGGHHKPVDKKKKGGGRK